ncbi:LytTR family transcriptional regulator DNA-binding domain-containing protein [Sphingomonas sp. JC676]|uniref:LytR/AlgR family response regulator transcription factor n=1 Tax=Sphingomonas sp. JC676 TaxID=2768065 RepID=UPI0016582FBE|nr:LytTR family transcriptional regulator DNA-binding domain-containing protein [Sphingomonas sp. JC676]MBC9035154.1 LytTR family transcriptional regulator DNA-binding domain-containing protein [Sphingomonas sp. JC676]
MISNKSLSALVVDDEAPARRRISDLLAKDNDIGAVIGAENGIAAIEMIQHRRPDIVFLDVQMPGVDGFGVIEAIGAEMMPLTVFVTAYNRFAIRAFEVDAIDYLLKPFSDRRFEQTMQRVKARLRDPEHTDSDGGNSFGPELLKLIARREKPGEMWDWIAVKSRDITRLVTADDIDWIEAAGVYVTVHAKEESFLYRAGLAVVANRLDPFRFVRIHRSHIVNVRSIASLERRSHGEFEVVLKTGTKLMMSRTYRSEVEAILGQPL